MSYDATVRLHRRHGLQTRSIVVVSNLFISLAVYGASGNFNLSG